MNDDLSEPARITLRGALAFLATISGGTVEPAVRAARIARCRDCAYIKANEKEAWCGAPEGCNCGVDGKVVGLWKIRSIDLTLYQETEQLLCKHPRRGVVAGAGWPMPDPWPPRK